LCPEHANCLACERGLERRSDDWPAGQSARQGRENSFVTTNELLLTKPLLGTK